MIFDVGQDFHDAVAAMPREHPKRRILELLEEAIRRDIHFIARHPTTLFQCMWNSCWWYDCNERRFYYDTSHLFQVAEAEGTLHALLQTWYDNKRLTIGPFLWFRAHRPPYIALDSSQTLVLRTEQVETAFISTNGHFIASVTNTGLLQLWCAHSGLEISRFQGCTLLIGFALQSTVILMLSDDNVLRMLGVPSLIYAGAVSNLHLPAALLLAPNGHTLASSYSECVRLWDINRASQCITIDTDSRPLSFSQDGTRLLCHEHQTSDHYDTHSLSIWDCASGHRIATVDVRSPSI